MSAGLIVDSFAGGGGASCGIEAALGRPVDIAINHDPEAVAMHRVNHPAAVHYTRSVWQVDPAEACAGRPVALAWFSPDCKHFSKAKGARPVKRSIRDLAWVVVQWARKVRPRVIFLENVEEFKDWGPVDRHGRPCKARKGRTFDLWIAQLRRLGYAIEWRELRACDYGSPTIRKRFFLVARCDGLPIRWPEPSHGPEGSGLAPYRSAASIIDWQIPCPSIFGRKRPLAEATQARIARGLKRFVIEAAEPFIVPVTHKGDLRVHPIGEPLRTVTTASRGEHALVTAFLAKHFGGVTGVPVDPPFPTITTRGTQNQVVTSHLVKLRGTCRDGQPVTAPAPTITAGGTHLGEVRAFLLKYYGTATGADLRDPLHSVTRRARFGLVMVQGEPWQIVDIGMRMLQPRELFAAQGFPPDYIIDRTAEGEALTKTAQIRMCGNAVCPQVAEALVRANCAHLIAQPANAAEEVA